MKQMTQEERNQISKLLDKKLATKLDEITAFDPLWKERVAECKHKRALGRLRVEKDVVELKTLESQIASLEEKRDAVQKRINSKMPKKDTVNKYSGERGCPVSKDLCEAVHDIGEEIHRAVMSKDASGKLILAAEAEHVAAVAALLKCCTREDVANAGIL